MIQIDFGHINTMILKCYHEQSIKMIVEIMKLVWFVLDVLVLYRRKSMEQNLLNQKMNAMYLPKLIHHNHQQLLLILYQK